LKGPTDVPTVGVGTIESIHAAGGKVLAIEADRTIVVDQDKTIELANRYGIVVVAKKESSAQDAAE